MIWLLFMRVSYLTCFFLRFTDTVADRMCRSGAVDFICVDSVSALTPRAEIEVMI